jgi:hypothetical protein
LLIDDAGQGLDDIAAGRVKDARQVLQRIKRRRALGEPGLKTNLDEGEPKTGL